MERISHQQNNRSFGLPTVLDSANVDRKPVTDGTIQDACITTYTICHYPVQLIDVVQLAGGVRITIRPTLPQDLESQRSFFCSLSVESRHFRFMSPLAELPEMLERRFASIDYHKHLALLAETEVDGVRTMIGEARYIVDPHDVVSGEFAISISDVWQNRGLAGILLEKLERQAGVSGLHRLYADTLRTNVPMKRVGERAGYVMKSSLEDSKLTRLEKRLRAG